MTFLYLQIKAVGVGIDNLIKCEDFAQEQVVETAQEGGGGVNSGDIKWKRGEMEFEAMMRLLDSMVMWQFIGYISLCSVGVFLQVVPYSDKAAGHVKIKTKSKNYTKQNV